jgi:hypothetical protein
MPAELPRRTVLGLGAAALAGLAGIAGVAGCGGAPADGVRARRSSSGAPVDAVTGERQLIAAYDALLPLAAGADRRLLQQLRAQHVDHLSRLVPPNTAGANGSGAGGAASGHSAGDLAELERRTARQLATAAAAAPAGQAALTRGGTAAVLASIGASHSAHAELLATVRLRPAGGQPDRPRSRRRGKS